MHSFESLILLFEARELVLLLVELGLLLVLMLGQLVGSDVGSAMVGWAVVGGSVGFVGEVGAPVVGASQCGTMQHDAARGEHKGNGDFTCNSGYA